VQVVLGQVTLAVQEHHSERNNRSFAVQRGDGVRKCKPKPDAECWMAMRKHLVYNKVYPSYASTI